GGQLEELVGDEDVDGLGDLHVVLVAGDHEDRGAGQVAQHHGAVVGGLEVGVLPGLGVGLPDGAEAEALGGLAAPQPGPAGDLRDDVVVDLDDGVRGGDGDVHRRVLVEGGDAVGDDALRQQG